MKWLARSMAAATVVLWAFVFPWGQTVLTWLDPIAASLARYGIAAVALLALALPSGQLLSAFRQNWRGFVAIGALGITCLQFLLFFSLNYTSALNASVIMALTPVITMAGAAMFLHEPLSGKASLGMAVSAAGALLAVLGDSPAGISGFTLDRGEPLALLAAVCMAFYTIGSRRLLDHRVSPIVNTALVVTMGLLGMLPLAAFVTCRTPLRRRACCSRSRASQSVPPSSAWCSGHARSRCSASASPMCSITSFRF